MNVFLVKQFKLLFLFLLCLNSHLVYGRFLVEPSTLYTQGRFEGVNGRGDFNGTGFGLNLGYAGNRFFIGLNLERLELKFQDHFTNENFETFIGGGVGSFMGFQLFDRIKIWTTYLNSTLEPVSNKKIRYFGQYYAIGLGLRLIDGLMLNAQSFTNHYTQIEDDTTGKTSGLDKNLATFGQSYGLSYLLLF